MAFSPQHGQQRGNYHNRRHSGSLANCAGFASGSSPRAPLDAHPGAV